jgi:hypothetical protein
MKIRYLGLEEELVHEEYNVTLVPGMGDMVWFDEAFYIQHIVWYPKEGMIQVYLSDEPPTKKKPIAESTKPAVNLDHALNKAQKTADKALKESADLKRQVFAIRQHLRAQGTKEKS